MNAVIFDFDGTIADSFDEVLVFFCNEIHRDPALITPEERKALRGLSMKDLALRVGIPAWRLPATYFKGKARLGKRMQMVKPFEGIVDVLKVLHAENYQLFIISSNSTRNINRFLVHHGLSSYFTRIYGNAGWFGKAKILRKTLVKYNLKPETTVYVGDEVRDLIGAKLAGMPMVAVSWGFGSDEQLLSHSPTVLVRKPAELQKTLIEWGKNV